MIIGEELVSHSVMKTRVNEDIAPLLKPVYERLSNRELLSKCLLGKTQNNNESFHIIWCKCKKVSI